MGRPLLLAGNANFLQGEKMFTFLQLGYEETAPQCLKSPGMTDCYHLTLTGLRISVQVSIQAGG